MIGFVAVARLRTARAMLAVLLLASAVATQLPLLDVPGYEFGEVLALALGFLGGLLGIAASRTPLGRQWPARAAGVSGLYAASCALGAVAVVAAGAIVGTRCSPWAGLPFVLLLPLPTAFLSTALGGLCGRAFGRRWAAVASYAAIALAGLVATLWPVYAGPQVFAFDHLFGWFPGPLYDERLAPGAALWLYRGLTSCAAAAVLAALWALEARRPRRRLLLAALLWAGFLAGVLSEHRFGAAVSEGDIDRALGGRLDVPGLVLHYPRELAPARVAQLDRLAELDVFEVSRALGLPGEPPVHVFFYRSAEEKGRLTGASETHFTKPWLRQIHTLADAEGQRVLRHELVHALAAVWGRPPFAVCAGLGGLDVQPGIVEGLAMAIDWPADDLTLHQWSRAMREAGLAPDIRTIVGPAGFAAAAQGRAYTLAGSFLRFLLDRAGPARMRRLYRDGDFEAAYGRPLDALAADWERFLSQVPLDAEARGAAQNRFRRGSIFAQPCAREMAALRAEAEAAGSAGNPALAAALLGRCRDIDPGDPSLLKRLWDAQRAGGDSSGAAATLRDLLASPALDPVLAAEVALARGDDAWKAADGASAKALWEQVLGAHIGRPARRAVEIRLAALPRPGAEATVQSYFAAPDSPASFLGLDELWARDPQFPDAAYLLGLRLAQEDERGRALSDLHASLAAGLTPDIAAKALRAAVGAEIDLGRYQDATADLDGLRRLQRSPAEDVLRGDLEARLVFERGRFGRSIPGLR